MSLRLFTLYEKLLAAYGPQGWWPLPSRAGHPGFDERGYHHGDYRRPLSAEERFEIVIGAILTQNTAWTNVEKALERLRRDGLTLPADFHACPASRLARLVRPSGYFNQKAKKLKAAARAFLELEAAGGKAPSREQLLGLWGIGPETADSILLYAFQRPVFVVDAYTKRLLQRLGTVDGRTGYDGIQGLFHRRLPRSHRVYNEMHALIVEHAKQHCRSKPVCAGCPVARSCAWRRSHA